MKNYPIFFFFILPALLPAQKPQPGKWWVEFTDKSNSGFCVCRPAEFLSARALERRARAGIAVLENDLPVNQWYVKGLLENGAHLHHTSRWLNAATVIADTSVAARLRQLPFVRQVRYLGRDIPVKNPPDRKPKKRAVYPDYPKLGNQFGPMGYALVNSAQMRTFLLHEADARGQGIWIAVLDGGFTLVDSLPFFDSVALQGRLWPGRDFVERDGAVFESSSHGASVLSVMAANLPFFFVGAAPEATYFLLKTEDTGGEYPVEEANWIAGAEWADSIGVDVINASLGYTTFSDTTMSHNYEELNGRTAIGSLGASIAAQKGMIICNSAGNSGAEAWRFIGVPADAPGIVAVGAVGTDDKNRAYFSSVGPSSDGRIKPELVAPGHGIVTAGVSGLDLGMSSGTSLASPILAGSIAALWSYFPEKTAKEILEAVFQSADQNENPDNERGYGLPDFGRAWLWLGGFRDPYGNAAHNGFFYADREADLLKIVPFGTAFENGDRFELKDWSGSSRLSGTVQVKGRQLQTVFVEGIRALSPGMYVLSIAGQAVGARFGVVLGK